MVLPWSSAETLKQVELWHVTEPSVLTVRLRCFIIVVHIVSSLQNTTLPQTWQQVENHSLNLNLSHSSDTTYVKDLCMEKVEVKCDAKSSWWGECGLCNCTEQQRCKNTQVQKQVDPAALHLHCQVREEQNMLETIPQTRANHILACMLNSHQILSHCTIHNVIEGGRRVRHVWLLVAAR